MASLQIKQGSKIEVKKGFVAINGPCVALYEIGKNVPILVKAYHLLPGETVDRAKGDDYIVEF